MDVGQDRRERLVSKQESDDGAVDASLKQLHGRRVPENMRRNPLSAERRTFLSSDCHMLRESICHAVAAERASPRTGE